MYTEVHNDVGDDSFIVRSDMKMLLVSTDGG